jgi:hypothetical protein
MLRTQGGYEGVPIADKKLHSEVEAAFGGVTAELLGASALGLQKPFGEQELGFAAGKIAQLKAETDGTLAVTISDGAQPEGIFADSFIDTLKSGKVTYYSFFGDYFTDQFDASPANGAYAVNDELYVVAGTGISDATRGLLTKDPAKRLGGAGGTGKKVGHVIQPADLANGVLLGFRWQPTVA